MNIYQLFAVLVGIFVASVHSYHDADNIRYDCWPLKAEKGASTIPCQGLALDWEPFPDTVEKGQNFNVTYQLRIVDRDLFYSPNNLFGNRSEEMIREFCYETMCPEYLGDVDETNCCVWHANIHTCHPTVTSVCGPWVSDDGHLSTHTDAQVGFIDTVFFAENVQIDFLGTNFIIAHLKVGNLQIALGKSIEVVARKFCGDGICGNGETCETCATDCCGFSFPVGATIGIVVFCVVMVLLIAVTIIVWNYLHRRKLFFDEGWIINYDEIKQASGHGGSLSSLRNMQLSSSTLASYQQPRRQLFTQTGVYEGRTVAIKKMVKKDIVLNNTVRKEVLQIRMLDHPNLCKFIGATVKDLHKLHIINEYCPKGSLNDVLLNDDIPLNWGFRFSFASDITRGMAYLHSKKIVHGRLTSSNVTIDDRWVVKIADYGLPSFRESDKETGIPQYGLDEVLSSHVLVKVYQPPEHRGTSKKLVTPASDVYSYAIILVEIATRMDPFSDEMFLDSNWKPAITKEHFSNSDNPCPCPEAYMELIDCCWSFLPTNRPNFDQVKKMLDRINPSRESPVDMMMIMMEKYSKHLETLVAERTQELILEQKKTATLLYSMLPRAIADELKQDKPAPAKLFQSSTIYFSDIVGFTNLAGSSTPFEVVTLLNELYSTFDDILDHFDVYKVETIGDAYMVVSGVPHENGDNHATEIAKMSLSLLAACKTFTIPHRPNTKLQIRIGIHSGPVCAGVVGLKMPRYCLFGDTVNTASRMESNSEAMRIQCSDDTYQLLKKQGGFHLDCRGSIEVKGKGSMVTWWLVGQEEQRRDSQQRRDSLTGINMVRSEGGVQSRKNNFAMKDPGALNMIKSEGILQYSNPAAEDTGIGGGGIVRNDGGRLSQMISLTKRDPGIRMGRNGSARKSCSSAMNGAGGVGKARSDGGFQLSSKRRGSIPIAKSEGGFSSPKRGFSQVKAVVEKNEGASNLEMQSYSKIVSFSSGHSQNSSSSQEQIDQNLPLPGTVMSDNEPLL